MTGEEKQTEKTGGFFQTLFYVFQFSRQYKGSVLSLIGVGVLLVFLTLLEPIFFREIIDTLIEYDTGRESISITFILILWGIIGFAIISLRLFISTYSDIFAHYIFTDTYRGFYQHVLDLSMQFHGNNHSGSLLKKLTRGTDGFFMIQLTLFRQAIPNIITLIVIIPVVLYLHFTFALIILGLGTVFTVIALLGIKITFSRQDAIEEYYTRASKIAGDSFSNVTLIKSFNLEKYQNTLMNDLHSERFMKQKPILYWWGFLTSFSQISSIVITFLLFLVGTYFYSLGEISVGEIVMFLGYSTILLSAIESLMWNIENMFWQIVRVKDFMEVYETEQTVQDAPDAKVLPRVEGKVEFKDVDFSYVPEKQVLTNIKFTVEPGEKIALVGHTGSGKTTTSSLLQRFYDVSGGIISIDGKDINKHTQHSLRSNIASVFQESFLFDTTIRDNIRLFDETVGDEAIEEVARLAHAWEFIQGLPNGLDTVVGERGVKLSGGEKQRIAIARAFLKDAPILVLDEATSALDAGTEKLLQDSLEKLMKGRTTFIIAHRLSTIKNADRIFVFDSGKIVESGNYKELVAKKGEFAKLVSAQVEGFIE